MSIIFNGKDLSTNLFKTPGIYEINSKIEDFDEFLVKYLKKELSNDSFSFSKQLVDTSNGGTKGCPHTMRDYLEKKVYGAIDSTLYYYHCRDDEIEQWVKDRAVDNLVSSYKDCFESDYKIQGELNVHFLGRASTSQVEACRQMILKSLQKEFGASALERNGFPSYEESKLDIIELKKGEDIIGYSPNRFYFTPRYHFDKEPLNGLLMACGIHPAFKDMIINDELSIKEAREASNRTYFAWEENENWEDNFFKYTPSYEMIKNISKLSNEQLELLEDNGFGNDSTYKIVKEMLVFQDGKPTFTADYLNFLHSLEGFNRGEGSPYHPDSRFTKIYQTSPYLRNKLEDSDLYTSMEITDAVSSFGIEFVENIFRDSSSFNQAKYILSTLEKTYQDLSSWVGQFRYENGEFSTFMEVDGYVDDSKEALSKLAKDYEEILSYVGNIDLDCFYDDEISKKYNFLRECSRLDYILYRDELKEKVPEELWDSFSENAKKVESYEEKYHSAMDDRLKEVLCSKEFVASLKKHMYLYATNQTVPCTAKTLCDDLSKEEIHPYEPKKQNEIEKMFKDKYRGHVPKIISFVQDLVESGYIEANDAVNRFPMKTIRDINTLGNPALFRLAYEMNINDLTSTQKEIITTYATPGNIDKVIEMKDFLLSDDGKNLSRKSFGTIMKNVRLFDLNILNELSNIAPSAAKQSFLEATIEDLRANANKEAFRENCFEYGIKESTFDNPPKTKIQGTDIIVEDEVIFGNKDERQIKAFILDKKDHRNFLVGEDTFCCMKPDEPGEECVLQAIVNPYAGTFIIEDEFGKMQASAFIWVDESKDTFVFDNIEFANDRDAKTFEDILYKFVSELPYENVQMGMGYNKAGSLGQEIFVDEYIVSPPIGDCYSDYYENSRILKRNGEVLLHLSENKEYTPSSERKISIAD